MSSGDADHGLGLVEVLPAGTGEDAASMPVVPGAPGLTSIHSQAISPSDPEQDRLRGLEDKILKAAMTTVEDSGYWQDVWGGEELGALKEPPQEWIDELGRAGAWRRFRVAMAATMNAKEAPVGLGMARATFMGITKVRSVLKVGSPTLNVQFVSYPAPQLQIIDVEGEEK